jgi:HlyD family secretion protein
MNLVPVEARKAIVARIGRVMTPEANSPHAPDGVRGALVAGAIVVGVLVFGGGLWAGTANLSGAVLASGTVVVDTNVKKIQHATGGTVGQIYVKDGDRVEKGELLLRLDETLVRASLQIVTKQLDEIGVRKQRLIAEQEEAETLDLPASARRPASADFTALLDAERRLFTSRREAREGQRAQLRQRILQLRQEADGFAAQQWSKGREIDLVGKELEGAETLWQRNLMPISKLTALKREAARLQGEQAQLKSQQAQAQGRIAETELQILQINQDLRSEVMKDLREATAKEGELVERRVAAEDQLRHIEIRAPQTGRIHQLSVHTEGGVIAQGEMLMQIVPEQDALVIEAKIAPQDIDHVRIGQPAFIRFTAFDQRTTPEFGARLVRVSADLAKEQETQQRYYLARLTLDEPPREGDAEPGRKGDRADAPRESGFKLVPGMPAEVHIRTGERTALSYFLKPLRDQFARAFTER